MPRKQYSLYTRLGGSCFGAIAVFFLGIGIVAVIAYVIDKLG